MHALRPTLNTRPTWPRLLALLTLLPSLGMAAPAAPAKPAVPLPDSVVMRIDGREDVTVRRFQRAVRLLGGSPDSLTPADRDRFLDLVLEQRVLAAHAVAKHLPWSHADSARYRSERDNTLLRAVLADEMADTEARRKAAGEKELDEQDLGVAARDSAVKRLHPVYDEELLKVVGSAFADMPRPTSSMSPQEQMKLMGRMPEIAARDTLKVLARSTLGDYTVADLLEGWRRLGSIYRPRITDNEGVRAQVSNGLFERSLRKAAADPAVAKRPEVAAVLADRVEYHAVNNFLQQEIVARIPRDSITLKLYHAAHKADFAQPARSILVTVMLGDSVTADSLARTFRMAGIAESLAFQAQRAGANYTQVVTAASDSALYARTLAIGVGGVGGPDRIGGDWRIFRVLSHEPRTSPPFGAVKLQVEQAWNDYETERRVRALLDQLKAAAKVERNTAVLRALVVSSPGKR